MGEADDAQLDEMLLRWEELHEQGRAVSIEELCAGSPELTGELCRRIDALLALEVALEASKEGSGLNSPRTRTAVEPHRVARSSAEFQDLRFLAEGALGEVFRAHHAELNREVALKFIKQARAGDEESRHRFTQEAEITGSTRTSGNRAGLCYRYG